FPDSPHVGNGDRNRNDAIGFHSTDDVSTTANSDSTIDMVSTARNVRHDCCSSHGDPNTATAHITCSTLALRYPSACTRPIDGTERGLYVLNGKYRDDAAVESVGDHRANPWQHDRNHIDSDPDRRPIDHRMQFHARRPADQ